MTNNSKKYNTHEDDNHLPVVNEAASVYFTVANAQHGRYYIKMLENTVRLNDDIIADWLNITPRTYRNYKAKDAALKPNMKEHVIMLLALYEHGEDVFSGVGRFEKWLSTPNVLLDNTAPLHFMNTISGIQMIDDRLTALEYGENV